MCRKLATVSMGCQCYADNTLTALFNREMILHQLCLYCMQQSNDPISSYIAPTFEDLPIYLLILPRDPCHGVPTALRQSAMSNGLDHKSRSAVILCVSLSKVSTGQSKSNCLVSLVWKQHL